MLAPVCTVADEKKANSSNARNQNVSMKASTLLDNTWMPVAFQ